MRKNRRIVRKGELASRRDTHTPKARNKAEKEILIGVFMFFPCHPRRADLQKRKSNTNAKNRRIQSCNEGVYLLRALLDEDCSEKNLATPGTVPPHNLPPYWQFC